MNDIPRQRSARWPQEIYDFIESYVVSNPCFYIHEFHDELIAAFPKLTNISLSTICYALRHDLKLRWKFLEKRAREGNPAQLLEFYRKLPPLYSYPEQLIFIDEASKDGRDYLRKTWVVTNKRICRSPSTFPLRMQEYLDWMPSILLDSLHGNASTALLHGRNFTMFWL